MQALSDLCGHIPEIAVNPGFVRSAEVRRLVGSRASLDAAFGAMETPEFEDTLAWMLAGAPDARGEARRERGDRVIPAPAFAGAGCSGNPPPGAPCPDQLK